MTLVAGIAAFIVILAILILVHEAGHFSVAKLVGVRVDEFGLGFPPRLKAWRRGPTIYSLNAIPLGGFVRMPGENGESDPPDNFGARPPWQRLCILAAGPAMNLLLAVAIFFCAYVVGSPRGTTEVTGIQKNSPAAGAGIRRGDRITAVNGHPVRWNDELVPVTNRDAGKRVTLSLLRNGRTVTISLIPRAHPPAGQGRMGILLDQTARMSYGPGPALQHSISDVGTMIGSVPQILSALFASGGKGVEGPIGIAHVTTSVVGQSPEQGPGGVLYLAALLSANLGVLNLLPIPALDGGRIVFVLLAWLRRRNINPEVEGLIHVVGMAALMLLIVFVSYHDIVQWVSGSSP